MNTDVKYPKVRVKLLGTSGNAFSILGLCCTAAKKNGVPKEEIKQFLEEAESGDYDHLLRTCCKWFTCQ